MTPKRRNDERAFTLLELLVVIAIIGILAALLLTTLSKVEARAQRIGCINNLRQLGIAMRSVVNDYHAYPLFVNGPGAWVAVLQHAELSTSSDSNPGHYLSQGVWKCPAANKPSNFPSDRGYASYGYNGYGLYRQSDTTSLGLGGHNVWERSPSPGNTSWPAPVVKESEIISPSEMMAIADNFVGENKIIKDGGLGFGRTDGLKDDYGSTKRSYARHQGCANVIFCDGHVESPTLKFLFEDTSDEALSRWNRDHLPHRERLSP